MRPVATGPKDDSTLTEKKSDSVLVAPPSAAPSDPGHRAGKAEAMTEPSEIRYLFIRRPILAGGSRW